MSFMPCDCSLIIPTHNRRGVLRETLTRIEALPDHSFETIVVDNGSTDDTLELRRQFPDVRWIDLGTNHGSAARNLGAVAADGEILFMLDDDSWPEPGTIDATVALFQRRPDLGAVACRVRLADQSSRHDAGGIPGIFFNCGGAIRKSAFVEVGGFPVDYDYYAEEYDLACRLWQRDWCIEPFGDLLVWHARVAANRDNNRMLRLLVRNNLRLWHRYAPVQLREDMIASTIDRYRRVAEKENAVDGFHAGLEDSRTTTARRKICANPLSMQQFEQMFGLDVARNALKTWADNYSIKRVAIWSRGKGCEQILSLVNSLHIRVDAVYDRRWSVDQQATWRYVALRDEKEFNPHASDGILIGSLSPGVAEDIRVDLSRKFAATPILGLVPWRIAATPEPALAV